MPIAFDSDRWARVRESARQWWDGELKRPLIQIRRPDRDPGRSAPKLADHWVLPLYGDAPADDVIDVIDYRLSRETYYGDAFPFEWANFGPGVLAAFLGGVLEANQDTVWFHPKEEKSPADLELRFDPENVWFRRIRDLMSASARRWGSTVQFGMTDIGGGLDVVSSFLPSERLVYAIYDEPDEVKRLTWEVHEAWWQAFDELDKTVRPSAPGYSCWTPIFSETSYYMLQCDFAYMIGPEMFDEFARPELAKMCSKLDHAFYHLDGPGQIVHLDSLLSIPELKGVQWIPGAGKPEAARWPELIERIVKAGKRAQILGETFEAVDDLAEKLGGLEGVVALVRPGDKSPAEIEAFLRRHGVEP